MCFMITNTGISKSALSPAIENLAYTKEETDALLNAKANKATTLSGYGITNGVTTNTAQDISAAKTFTATPTITSNGLTSLNIKSTLTTGILGVIRFRNAQDSVLSGIYYEADGAITADLLGATKAFKVHNQRAYNASNTTDVATIGTLDAYSPMVRTSGNQTIGGIKTFSANINGTIMYLAHESSGSRAVGTYQLLFKIAKSKITQAGIRGHFGIIRTGRANTGFDILQVEMNQKTATGIGLALPKFFNNKDNTYILSQDDNYIYVSKVNKQTLVDDSTNVWIGWQWQIIIESAETLADTDMALSAIPGTEVNRV